MINLTPKMSEILVFIVETDVPTTMYHTELEQALTDSEFYSELNDVYIDGKFVVSTNLSDTSVGFFLISYLEDAELLIKNLDTFVKQFFNSFEYEDVKPKYLGYKIDVAKALTY